jgi:hypothetical protein
MSVRWLLAAAAMAAVPGLTSAEPPEKSEPPAPAVVPASTAKPAAPATGKDVPEPADKDARKPEPPAPKAPEPDPRDFGPVRAAEGDEAEMLLRDGRTISGKVIRVSDESVIFEVGGVPTKFELRSIERVSPVAPFEDRYKALQSSIDSSDAQGLMRLAEWLNKHAHPELAIIEIDRALAADPGNPDARSLKLLISEQAKIAAASKLAADKKKATQATDGPGTQTPKPAASERPAKTVHDFPLLNADQINTLRVYEVDLADPPKMTIARDVITQFLDKYGGQKAENHETIPTTEQGRKMFAARKPEEILDEMFAIKARDFYPRVKVLENPKSLQLFRENVNRSWLVNSCATNRCHGGEEAGKLWLYDKKPMTDSAAMTNFFILEQFRISGEDGKRTIPLINYAEPANSPLLQLGLPRASAGFKHPESGGRDKGRWRPAFQSQDDEQFKRAVEWIRQMYPKRTAYPIDYTPPVPHAKGIAPESADGGGR